MQGRYIPEDSFGEITQHTVMIPFYVTAGSRTMAIRKLLHALKQTNECPVIAAWNTPGKSDAECDQLAAEIAMDDPREITGHWDFPEEFIELSLDDRLQKDDPTLLVNSKERNL